jgi:hypothetical protein
MQNIAQTALHAMLEPSAWSLKRRCGCPHAAPSLRLTLSPTSRPLGALLDNVAQGYMYQPVTWAALADRPGPDSPDRAVRTLWHPLMWAGAGDPPPLLSAEALAPKPGPPRAALTPGGAGRPPGRDAGGVGAEARGRMGSRGGRRGARRGGAARAAGVQPPLTMLADALLPHAQAPQQQQQQQQQQYLQLQGQLPPQPPQGLQLNQQGGLQQPQLQQGLCFEVYGHGQGQHGLPASLFVQEGGHAPGLLVGTSFVTRGPASTGVGMGPWMHGGAGQHTVFQPQVPQQAQQAAHQQQAGGLNFMMAAPLQLHHQLHNLPQDASTSAPMMAAQQQLVAGATLLHGGSGLHGGILNDPGLQAHMQLQASAPQLRSTEVPYLGYSGLAAGLGGLSVSVDAESGPGAMPGIPVSTAGMGITYGTGPSGLAGNLIVQGAALAQPGLQHGQMAPPTQPPGLSAPSGMGSVLQFGMPQPHPKP